MHINSLNSKNQKSSMGKQIRGRAEYRAIHYPTKTLPETRERQSPYFESPCPPMPTQKPVKARGRTDFPHNTHCREGFEKIPQMAIRVALGN